MILIAKTFQLQQQIDLQARLMGLVRCRIARTTLFAVSFVMLLIGMGLNRELDFTEVAAAERASKPPTPVPFLNVIKGYRSGIREPLQTVVRSQAEWTTLWRRHSNDLNATPPTVLFDQEIAAVVFLGEKSTGGYDITITRAEQTDDALVIYYQEKTPGPGSTVIQVFQQPFHIVRMNREVGTKVTFRRES